MNRRGFLRALVAAPIAAAVAPLALARPAFATGGLISGSVAVTGEFGAEAIIPTRQQVRRLMAVDWLNPARQFQHVFEEEFGVNEANTAIFDANAAYCDELVEVENEQA